MKVESTLFEKMAPPWVERHRQMSFLVRGFNLQSQAFSGILLFYATGARLGIVLRILSLRRNSRLELKILTLYMKYGRGRHVGL